MHKAWLTVLLLLPWAPLAHGCHREDDDIRTRWFTIYTWAAPAVGACWGRRRAVTPAAKVTAVADAPVSQSVSTRLAA